MSQELSAIRRALTKVPSDIKQGKLIPAATAVRDAAKLFGRVPMMRNEADEFASLLFSACDYLRYDKQLAQLFPLKISYAPGKEGELVTLMNSLIEALQESSTEDALRVHAEKKATELEKGKQQLSDGEHDEARKTMSAITTEYADDAELSTDVGECFLEAGLVEDATKYLNKAANLNTASPLTFNRLGITLRKMGRLDKAEQYFLKALEMNPGDPNLWFNLGRTYLDGEQWAKAAKCGDKAVKLAPEFETAAKLATYAKRKVEAG